MSLATPEPGALLAVDLVFVAGYKLAIADLPKAGGDTIKAQISVDITAFIVSPGC
ncbi:hypothetical protein [Thalassomonas sp. RHCl1]|uniref:hypothetical protein n=1 Tax=Thalassomonas sp. RHCl1 TaxID=2995320 RepID=UPI00248CB0DC|nr:hypothetical protein [Thalassomonas sp. RHCl1]